MLKPNIFIVHLRQPGSSKDPREDPYWEVGSFGCTGCKGKTLLNPNPKRNRVEILKGSRFAFVQGGPKGTRLIFLTPPIEVNPREINDKPRLEVRWKPCKMPLRYENAPLLVGNNEDTDFPRLKPLFENADRSTGPGKFSSRFRSCVQPLPIEVAEEIKTTFDAIFSEVPCDKKAQNYLDAITDLEAWKEQIKKMKGWEHKERVRAYNDMCAAGTSKRQRCGKRGC